jgi:hypothetical protein
LRDHSTLPGLDPGLCELRREKRPGTPLTFREQFFDGNALKFAVASGASPQRFVPRMHPILSPYDLFKQNWFNGLVGHQPYYHGISGV